MVDENDSRSFQKRLCWFLPQDKQGHLNEFPIQWSYRNRKKINISFGFSKWTLWDVPHTARILVSGGVTWRTWWRRISSSSERVLVLFGVSGLYPLSTKWLTLQLSWLTIGVGWIPPGETHFFSLYLKTHKQKKNDSSYNCVVADEKASKGITF